MTVLVVDGQGGGIGKSVISELKSAAAGNLEIIAVGANSAATSAMMRAGADAGATGENPVVYNAGRADVIIGPIGILLPNAMLGEITPAMAAAVAGSAAQKILIPFSKCSVSIAGLTNGTLEFYIKQAVEMVLNLLNSAPTA